MLSCLTDTQLQRLTMKAEGMTLRQIAEAERTSVNAVRDSLLQVRKNLRNIAIISEILLYKTACFSPYSERVLSNLQEMGKNQRMRDYRRN